jgi:hypothetical protein
VQAHVEKMYFIFNLEYRYAALSRGMLHRLSTKSHAQQKPKYPSEMSGTQWPNTLHISLNQKKLDGPVSVWADELQWLVFKYWMFRFPKPEVLVFTGLFPTASFWGRSIKPFPLPPLEAASATHEIHSS